MAKHKVTGIKKGAVVKIEVGSGFYFRISQLLIEYGTENFPGEELGKAMEHLKDKEPVNNEEYHLLTLLSLVHEIETQAKIQDLLVTEEVEIPDIPETSPGN